MSFAYSCVRFSLLSWFRFLLSFHCYRISRWIKIFEGKKTKKWRWMVRCGIGHVGRTYDGGSALFWRVHTSRRYPASVWSLHHHFPATSSRQVAEFCLYSIYSICKLQSLKFYTLSLVALFCTTWILNYSS